ncbi:putative C6 transcription factor [Aspergillus undulatus]|uniref:putative C6 transcription factor n=1 Tax=Aspergillus undulatus TaxID=1810928 RepID=UPI003CCDCB08
MSYTRTKSMSSPTGLAPREGDVSDDLLVGDEQRVRGEDGGVKTERLACDRCRQRKIKCDRVRPCSQCKKSASQCTYKLSYQVKERKQRILVSDAYESRLEQISDKIDELSEMMKKLSHERSVIRDRNIDLAVPTGMRVSSRSSLPPIENQAARCDHPSGSGRPPSSSESQCIESTLFEHVVFAAKYIERTVESDPHSHISAEIRSVLDTLWSTIKEQKQQDDTVERLRPFANSPLSVRSFKDLPIPPMGRVFPCLRFAQDRSPNQLYWPFEFGSVGDFATYIVKVCSPGPATEAELIIVHYVLYWLFTECSNAAEEDGIKQDYEAQALTCRNSLEIVLSSLSIHIATNMDSVRAMYMATLYCLQRGKPFAAWTFISRAALMCQELGLNNSYIMTTEPPEERQPKLRLFWAVYVIEKAVSLRLGRPSTIRDHDITVPRLHLDRRMASLAHNRLPDWIDVANLYGRVYDNIYSPCALAQPGTVRGSRIMALASEFEAILAAREEFYKRPNTWSSHAVHPRPYALMIHANKATDYSTLACIYKARPSNESSTSVPHAKCLAAARASLNEAEACITMLANTGTSNRGSAIDTWISEVISLFSLMPFLILFGNVIETSAQPDLDHLQRYVGSLNLHSMAQSSRLLACSKQMRIFEALYDVAAKYVEAKSKTEQEETSSNQLADFDLDFAAYLDENNFHWLPEIPFASLPTMPMCNWDSS